jgi:hypothetical protein
LNHRSYSSFVKGSRSLSPGTAATRAPKEVIEETITVSSILNYHNRYPAKQNAYFERRMSAGLPLSGAPLSATSFGADAERLLSSSDGRLGSVRLS